MCIEINNYIQLKINNENTKISTLNYIFKKNKLKNQFS